MIYRAVDYIFKKLHEHQARNPTFVFSICVSFLELYNEELIDLLNPATRNLRKRNGAGVLGIRDDGHGGVVWDGVQEELVQTPSEIMAYLKKGSLCRTTGSTDMNAASSRSHAIFSIIVKQEGPPLHLSKTTEGLDVKEESSTEYAENEYSTITPTAKLISKLNFVDLAGSERVSKYHIAFRRSHIGQTVKGLQFD